MTSQIPDQRSLWKSSRILQLHGEILVALGSPDAQVESDRERELLERLNRGASSERHPVFHVWYQNLAVNYIELTLKQSSLTAACMKLKTRCKASPASCLNFFPRTGPWPKKSTGTCEISCNRSLPHTNNSTLHADANTLEQKQNEV